MYLLDVTYKIIVYLYKYSNTNKYSNKNKYSYKCVLYRYVDQENNTI